MKQSKPFTFLFPLTERKVVNCKIVHEHVGDLQVEGFGYFNPNASVLDIHERFSADIDFVKWNGNDIKPVLECTSDIMEDIFEAAVQHTATLFPQPSLFEQMCETVRIHNKIFYGL